MKKEGKLWFSFLLYLFCIIAASGQASFTATGGTGNGKGGSVTYTVGQVTDSVLTGTNSYIVEGVQQPYEISVVTAIENVEDISLECSIYPNPASGIIKLVIRSVDRGDLSYLLYNLSGSLIQEGKVTGEESEIILERFFAGTYFLKVIRNNLEVRVFKIVKR